jgi:hypothetical protein
VSIARLPVGRAARLSPGVVDGLLALLVTALTVASLVARVSQVRLTPAGAVRFRTPDPAGVALVLAGSLVLAVRRRSPLGVLAVSGTAFIAHQALGYAPPPLPFAPLIAAYTLAATAPAAVAVSATTALLLGLVAALIDPRN